MRKIDVAFNHDYELFIVDVDEKKAFVLIGQGHLNHTVNFLLY